MAETPAFSRVNCQPSAHSCSCYYYSHSLLHRCSLHSSTPSSRPLHRDAPLSPALPSVGSKALCWAPKQNRSYGSRKRSSRWSCGCGCVIGDSNRFDRWTRYATIIIVNRCIALINSDAEVFSKANRINGSRKRLSMWACNRSMVVLTGKNSLPTISIIIKNIAQMIRDA